MRGYSLGRRARRPIEAMRKKVPRSVGACFELIERELFRGPVGHGRDAIRSPTPIFLRSPAWMEGDGVDPRAFPRVDNHRNRMGERAAVRRALADESEA